MDRLDEGRIYAKVTRRIVPLIVVCYLAAYLDRVNISFAKLQMQSDLGLSDLAYGIGAGAFFIGYFLFEIPSNLILHHVGARKWIARIMISWGLVSALMAFTQELARPLGIGAGTVFYLLRFLLGVAEAGFFPGVILYFTTWYPTERLSPVMGWLITAQPVAFVIGGPLSGGILASGFHALGLHTWQWLLLLEAAPALLLGFAVLILLEDRITPAKWLSDGEKHFLTAELEADRKPKRDYPFRQLVAVGALWTLTLIYLLMVIGYYGINFWLPSLIQGAGVRSFLAVGLLTAMPYLVATGLLVVATRSVTVKNRHRQAVAAAVLSGLSFLMAQIFSGGIALTLIFMTVAIAGALVAMAIFWSFPATILTGASAAAGIAFINSIGNLGGFLGPTLLGWFSERLGTANRGLAILGACMLIAGLLMAATCGPYRQPRTTEFS